MGPADDDSCVVCMDAEKTHVFVPCGHVCACAECSAHVMSSAATCPYCRTHATMAVRIYGV